MTTKDTLIKQTISLLSRLPQDKVREVSDYTETILKKLDDELLNKGIQEFVSNSKSFEFLQEEEDLYTTEDLKEKY
ncbi:MAG: hypothetical protein GY816_12560 [Cytophagales bacterium]|nr:hypothetical protein [Cytophagales bacterium]